MPQPQTKPMFVNIPWPQGKPLALKLQVPTGRVGFADVLPQLYAIGDAVIARSVEESSAQGASPSCSAGCSHCCNQFFTLPPQEALYLLRVVDTMAPAMKRHVQRKFYENYRALESSGRLRQALEVCSGKLSRAELGKFSLEYMRLDIQCPFLMQNMCGIYEHRPMVCRSFLKVSGQEECRKRKHGGNGGKSLPIKLPLADAMGMFDGVGQTQSVWTPPVFLQQRAKELRSHGMPKDKGTRFVSRFLEFLKRSAAAQKRVRMQVAVDDGLAASVLHSPAGSIRLSGGRPIGF